MNRDPRAIQNATSATTVVSSDVTTMPFAFGPSGRWLTSTQGNEVFICDGGQEHTVHIVALDHEVIGVRNTIDAVLALDAAGTLYGIDPLSGRCVWRAAVGASQSLTAVESGRWVVVGPGGLSWGDGPQHVGTHELTGIRAAACDPSGATVAVVTERGEMSVLSLGSSAQLVGGPHALGFEGTGVAFSGLGWWLVSTTRGIFRVPTTGGTPELFLKWGGESPPAGVVCSTNGRLCAFRAGTEAVAIFGVEVDVNCGAIVYMDRQPGELEFGPDAWLGIGLGSGDGNKIDLLTGACHRTDPPADRPRNRWMLQVGVDPAEVAEVYGHAPAGASPSDGTDALSFEAIGTYVERRLLEPMNAVRILSIVGFVLLGAVLAILASVVISGAEGSDDIGVPLVISGILFAVLGLGMFLRSKKVKDIRRLAGAIRTRDPSPIAAAGDVDVIGEGAGLEFALHGSPHRYCVAFDPDSLMTLRAWLGAPPGAF